MDTISCITIVPRGTFEITKATVAALDGAAGSALPAWEEITNRYRHGSFSTDRLERETIRVLPGRQEVLGVRPGAPTVVSADAHLLVVDIQRDRIAGGQLMRMTGGLQISRLVWPGADAEIPADT